MTAKAGTRERYAPRWLRPPPSPGSRRLASREVKAVIVPLPAGESPDGRSTGAPVSRRPRWGLGRGATLRYLLLAVSIRPHAAATSAAASEPAEPSAGRTLFQASPKGPQ